MGLGKIFVARVRQRIDCHHRLHSFDNQSGQTFARPHRHLSHGLLVQSHGRAQSQTLVLAIKNIDGANLGSHPFRDRGDDVIESLLKVARVTDQCADVFKNRQVRVSRDRSFLFFCHKRRSSRLLKRVVSWLDTPTTNRNSSMVESLPPLVPWTNSGEALSSSKDNGRFFSLLRCGFLYKT